MPAPHNIGSQRVPLAAPRKQPSLLGPCKHKGVKSSPGSAVSPGFEAPFDKALGLVFTEINPDQTCAELEVAPKLLQPMGIVHGGVYCSMVESLASVAAYTWLQANGGGSVVGVNNCGWSPSPTPTSGSSPAARSGCRTSRQKPANWLSPPRLHAIRPPVPLAVQVVYGRTLAAR